MNSGGISYCPPNSKRNQSYVNLKPVASHTCPTILEHIPSSSPSSPSVETCAEQEITPVRAFSRSSVVNCLIDRMRSGSGVSPCVSGPSSSRFRFFISRQSHAFAVQETQLDDGSPRAPCLLFLSRSGNWSLGLLLSQLRQRRSGSCSMVVEGNFRFKTDTGQAEPEHCVRGCVSHNLSDCEDIYLQIKFVHYVPYRPYYILWPSIYYSVFDLLPVHQS